MTSAEDPKVHTEKLDPKKMKCIMANGSWVTVCTEPPKDDRSRGLCTETSEYVAPKDDTKYDRSKGLCTETMEYRISDWRNDGKPEGKFPIN